MLTISKKNVEIRINAPILSDPAFIETACQEALDRVAEAIVHDVVVGRADVFADSEGKWSFPGGGYPDGSAYYGSGMVPYWRGELLGSFQKTGAIDKLSYGLEFTAPYARLIEEGGEVMAPPPQTWEMDKNILHSKNKLTVIAHPYVGSVAYKIEEHMADFGYLDIFAVSLLDAVKG